MSEATVNDVVDTVFGEIGEALKQDGRIAVPAFGTFAVHKRAVRKGCSPRTDEAIKIKVSKTVAFKPVPSMKKGL